MLPPRPAGTVRIAQAEVTYTALGQSPQRQVADVIVSYSPDAAVYNPLERVM